MGSNANCETACFANNRLRKGQQPVAQFHPQPNWQQAVAKFPKRMKKLKITPLQKCSPLGSMSIGRNTCTTRLDALIRQNLEGLGYGE